MMGKLEFLRCHITNGSKKTGSEMLSLFYLCIMHPYGSVSSLVEFLIVGQNWSDFGQKPSLIIKRTRYILVHTNNLELSKI